MPRSFRFNRWWLAALVAVAVWLPWLIFRPGEVEPVYQGRRLGEWLNGHPKDYHPAVRAIGTNALPYLLAELQATDSGSSRLAQSILAKVSIGPFWRTARLRRYRAGLGIQILDTNAAPALADMIFRAPMQVEEGDPGYSAASSLRWLSSLAAQGIVRDRLVKELHGLDLAMCRNACLTFTLWSCPTEGCEARLVELTRATDPVIRAAAVRALNLRPSNQELFLPALIDRLDDEQSKIRRLAIGALQYHGSNAVAALTALRAAYTNELTRLSLRDDLKDGLYGSHTWSAKEIRWAIRDAIRAIDPGGPLPE